MSKGNIRGLVFGLVWGVVGIALAGVAYPPGGAGGVADGADLTLGDVTLTGTLLVADGSEPAPSIAPASDPDTGLRFEANTVRVTTGGQFAASFTTASFLAKSQIRTQGGTESFPAYSGNGGSDTGMDFGAADVVDLVAGGTKRLSVSTTEVTSTLPVSAPGLLLGLVTKTGAYTATATDHTIICDATSAAFTVTLPPATGLSGTVYVVKKIDASNTVTIDGDASETIDGATTQALTTQYDSVTVQCDGTGWHIL